MPGYTERTISLKLCDITFFEPICEKNQLESGKWMDRYNYPPPPKKKKKKKKGENTIYL